jgi:hypothetical protein
VSKSDGVGRGIETNLVRARMRAGAAGTGVDITFVAGGLHPIHQLDQRTGRRVFLSDVVNLPSPGAVFLLIRQQTGSF